VKSYAPERANRPDTVKLWQKIHTTENPKWTERYHSIDPNVKAFGGRITITLNDGTVISDELAVANAHPLGATPWTRPDYIKKFRTLAEGIITPQEADRFLDVAQRLPELSAKELYELEIILPAGELKKNPKVGIFGFGQ
jgi:2-methylcitrate dehydratase